MARRAPRMLVVLAHPDDEAFGPAGALASCADLGVEITLAMATRGEAGRRRGSPPFCTPQELGTVRWAELHESCRILGLKPPVPLGLSDKAVSSYDESHVAAVASLISDLSPGVVVTLGPEGGLSAHPDHRAASRLTLDAWLSLAGDVRPRLAYYQRNPNSESVRQVHGFAPGHLVVSVPVRARHARLEALRAHRSQTEQVESLWMPDNVVLSRLPETEHFMVPDRLLGGRRVEGDARILLPCRQEQAAGSR